ncbi:hypothetical protein P9J64_16935 [Deltaproteobacteria bacterium IMCC39524]|nr:hypothetical protein [Deltaproteobacteria bacterium IMCC39524]
MIAIKRIAMGHVVRWAFIGCQLLAVTACSAPGPERSDLRIFWPLDDSGPKLEFMGGVHSDLDLVPFAERNQLLDAFTGRVPNVTLKQPFGIVALAPGRVLVTDAALNCILLFDIPGRTVKPFSSFFSGEPLGIDTDMAGNVYVTNASLKAINVFNRDGQPLATIAGGTGLVRPSYLALHKGLQRVYLADAARHKIVVYDTKGNHLFDIGSPGNDPGEFAVPQGMAFDDQGKLFVADMLNCRIQVFDADGHFLYTFGHQGTKPWGFEYPRDLAFASDGTLYIVDHRKGMLLAYQPEGKFLFAVGKGKPTSHPLGFSTPTSLEISSDGALYVTEPTNGRFSMWQVLNDNYLDAHPLSIQDQIDIESFSKKYSKLTKRLY